MSKKIKCVHGGSQLVVSKVTILQPDFSYELKHKKKERKLTIFSSNHIEDDIQIFTLYSNKRIT